MYFECAKLGSNHGVSFFILSLSPLYSPSLPYSLSLSLSLIIPDLFEDIVVACVGDVAQVPVDSTGPAS
jgi:hypothetical protein